MATRRFTPGDEVFVRNFTAGLAAGTVLTVVPGGAVVRLEQFNEHEGFFLLDDLELQHDPAAEVKEKRERPAVRNLNERRAIEALRFGIVPGFHIEEMTIGFNHLRNWIRTRLPEANDQKPLVSKVVGNYGDGKSHTMALLRHIAVEENYVTAHVELDGTQITLANPEGLLCSLWSTLSGRKLSRATPVLDLYRKAVQTGFLAPATVQKDHEEIEDRVALNYQTVHMLERAGITDDFAEQVDAILSSTAEYTVQEVASQIRRNSQVPAGSVKLRKIIGTEVAGRARDFVVALAGVATVARHAGYKGLVITFDEFDVEDHFVTNPNQAKRVISVFADLHEYLEGESPYYAAPLSIFFAAVDGSEGSYLAEVMKQMLTRLAGQGIYKIQALGPAEQVELGRRIHELYSAAYDLDLGFNVRHIDDVRQLMAVSHVGSSSYIRGFIKHYVAWLDSQFGPPL